jgi:excisionase family DNA binding protein
MNVVDGARTNLPDNPPAPIGHVEVSYLTRNWPGASLESEQLETLADLIASRVQQATGGRAPAERKQLVTARQAAEILAVDLKTVYRHAKELGGWKVGGAWRFDLDARAEDAPVSARYASERPQSSERAAAQGGGRSGKGARDRVRCQLLPVGRALDRAG